MRGAPQGLRPGSNLASRDVGGLRTGLAERQGGSQSGDDPAGERGRGRREVPWLRSRKATGAGSFLE